MIMKKCLILSVLFLVSVAVTAQEQKHEFEITGEPEFIESACNNCVFMEGISENGRYCWGTLMYDAYFCDLETGDYTIVAPTHDQKYEQGYIQSGVAAVTNDGIAFINLGHRETYLLNIATGEKTYLQSPMKDYPYVYIWDISRDGNVIGGNFIDKGNHQYPMVGTKQEDGTYKLTPLEFERLDAIGDSAQFTQVRRVMSSGKYLAGSQIDRSGSVARAVVWKLNEDGTYKYTTPLDDMLYDFSAEKPGPRPVFEDYVTEKDNKSAEYKKQKKEYYKIVNEWNEKFAKFTRNLTTVDWAGFQRSARDNWVCSAIQLSVDEYNTKTCPLYYNCDNNKVIQLDGYEDIAKGFAMLSEGKYLTIEGNRWTKLQIYDNGVIKPFHEWLKEKTGVDVSEMYHFEYTDLNTGMQVDDVLMGLPIISYDGKTLLLTTFDHGGYKASVIRFNKSILGDDTETGMSAEVVDNFNISGSVIDGDADVDVYTLDGKMVKSIKVSGHTDLKDILSSGSYVVKVRSDKNVTRSFKLFVL